MENHAFVDTHIHFWDQANTTLRYSWLQPEAKHWLLGERVEELKYINYLLNDYIAETRNSNVTKAVHIQAAIGSKDPVAETRWLQDMADQAGFPLAIIAYSNLKSRNVGSELERHCSFANMRGIRDFSEGDYLVDPDFHRGFALLKKFDLVASMSISWESMSKTRALALKFPDIPMVIDHCGLPTERTPEYFANWRKQIIHLAEAENTVCKISGLGMRDSRWTIDSIKPWVLTCIEAFGPSRCIFGSNWPVDKLYSTFGVLVEAYTALIKNFSDHERGLMFARNAEQLYKF